MSTDPRLDQIINQILCFVKQEYGSRLKPSDKKDEIDAIMAGLNILGEQLQEEKLYQQDKERRKAKIMDILLKYTVLDFSEKAEISGEKDELDAISAGLNSMSEEIIFFRDELEKKAEQLSATNKELESFTYSVSHDLRAPLRAVHGYSQILLEDFSKTIDSEGKRILGNIMTNAKKMGELIDNLLAYSRMGKKELNTVNINPNKLVKNILFQLNESQSHNAEIIVHPMPNMHADYTLISLVFQNLISNAIKYSSKTEHPIVEVGHEEIDEKKAYYVRDNGAGFDMEYYDKLFGVFQRLHRDEEFEGTGVGLAIVQRILLKHGGSIWAEGEPGKGATFYFTIT